MSGGNVGRDDRSPLEQNVCHLELTCLVMIQSDNTKCASRVPSATSITAATSLISLRFIMQFNAIAMRETFAKHVLPICSRNVAFVLVIISHSVGRLDNNVARGSLLQRSMLSVLTDVYSHSLGFLIVLVYLIFPSFLFSSILL